MKRGKNNKAKRITNYIFINDDYIYNIEWNISARLWIY